ncbi:MAG: hypothetical protein H0V66_05120 [Bdellovibrionales bacterium]|nr:hypothetical protein [Bdellovibrionales bacterium]
MILLLLLTSLFSFAETTSTDEKVVGIFYMKPLFGHVHQSSVRTSASLTTIQCAHPVKVIESSKVSVAKEWAYVQVAEYRGFIMKQYLSEKKPECIQGKYPKFFDALNMDLSELYYWGRLYDHYIQGETRVQ